MQALATWASPRLLAAFENIWREVIADHVVSMCSTPRPVGLICSAEGGESSASDSFFPSGSDSDEDDSESAHSHNVRSNAATKGGNLQQDALNSQVSTLISFLERCRAICRVDLALKNMMCHMSADLGFMLAFRRLSKPVVLELAKALAVRVSSLLDTLKHPGAVYQGSNSSSSHNHWARSLEQVIDLVQVLCNQTNNTEFGHFYELLLARRLLRYRFISLGLEQRVLTLLPGAMRKNGSSMIRDLRLTGANMQAFRAFVLHRVDNGLGFGIDVGTDVGADADEGGGAARRSAADACVFPSDMMALTFQAFDTPTSAPPATASASSTPNSVDQLQHSRLNIHLLSGTVWPSYWVSATKCVYAYACVCMCVSECLTQTLY